MKNKIAAVLLVLSLIIGCLAGCGSSKENDSSAAGESREISQTQESLDEEKTELPSEILNPEDSFRVTSQRILEIPAVDENICIMQGGCVTEEYAWFVIAGKDNNGSERFRESCIVKYDMETMEEVYHSEKLLLGHANDIAYVPETNELYVTHAWSKEVSILDADTLTVKDTKTLKMSNYAIEYNQSRETFVTGCSTAGMVMYDKELKMCGATLAQDTTLTTQGICADDKYVYHILHSPKSNTKEPDDMIFVLDWDGNLIAKVTTDNFGGYEPENISLVGDTFYIGCTTSSGGLLFTAKLVKTQSE